MPPCLEGRRRRGEGRGHVAAFSEIVFDSSNVKGSEEGGGGGGEESGYRGEKRVCVGLRGEGGGGSECLFSGALGIRSNDRLKED